MSRPAARRLMEIARSLHWKDLQKSYRVAAPILLTGPPPTFRRSYETSPNPGSSRTGIRISYLFGGLVGVGLLVTTYGLLEYYFSLQTWPEPVRSPLKAALKARNRGDYDRADSYFQKAIEAALSIPSSSLAPDPLQKLTGLYISYAALLESQGELVKAYITLRTALTHLGEDPLTSGSPSIGNWAGSSYTFTRADHSRAIGLTQKLGHLALQLSSSAHPAPFPVEASSSATIKRSPSGWLEAAETYLSGALTAMLKLGLNKPGAGAADSETGSPSQAVVLGRDIDLGDSSAGRESNTEEVGSAEGRVDKRGLGMTMEALSEVYARKKQYDLAGQLLLQAVSILLPPGVKETPPVSDRCQAAMLMTAISSHTIHPRTEQAIKISRSWSLRALQIADQAISDATGSNSDTSSIVCKRARVVGLHNLGMAAEIEKDSTAASSCFEQSLSAAKEINFVEGRREAMEAMRRIRNQGISDPPLGPISR